MGRGGDNTQTPASGKAPAGPRTEFFWDDGPEPHCVRKAKILKAHPEVNSLMGPCPNTKYQVALVVSLQIAMAYAMSGTPWWLLAPVAWLVGGVASCNLQLAMHEISHNLAFKSPRANRLLSLLANLPLGVPAAISFRKYHLEHHKYQGHDVVDVDIPTEWEGVFFTSPARKFLWCLMQPLFYAFRPLVTNPKPLVEFEALNAVVQIAFDAAVWYMWGFKGLAYLLLSTLLGMGVHPTAFHFISEHCVFDQGFETYSYYGPLNVVMYNVGYHNEHHDFPNIPGSRLPRLKKMAPEYYDTIPSHTSWSKVYVDFIFRTDICPFSRVKREPTDATKAARDKKAA